MSQRLTAVIVSVFVWKHQDRIQKVGYPTDDKDNILISYDQVIWADREIKNLYASWPVYLRELDESLCAAVAQESSFPVRMMPALVLLSVAHKVCCDVVLPNISDQSDHSQRF